MVIEDTMIFSDELQQGSKRQCKYQDVHFNDYFIRNIITRKDGGFIIGSEAYYTTSRGNSWNR